MQPLDQAIDLLLRIEKIGRRSAQVDALGIALRGIGKTHIHAAGHGPYPVYHAIAIFQKRAFDPELIKGGQKQVGHIDLLPECAFNCRQFLINNRAQPLKPVVVAPAFFDDARNASVMVFSQVFDKYFGLERFYVLDPVTAADRAAFCAGDRQTRCVDDCPLIRFELRKNALP